MSGRDEFIKGGTGQMPLLAHKKQLCDGRLTARFLRQVPNQEPLVVCIPGGPGLGSSYLDPFMFQLAQRASVNTGILDLPNHGESAATEGSLTYPECADLVGRAVLELISNSQCLFLFGQSFGARLVFDLLPKLGSLGGAILTGFPYAFQNSEGLLEKIGNLSLEPLENPAEPDAVFARNWKKIFPLYTTRPLAPTIADALSTGTRWSGNDRMLENVPPIERTVEALSHNAAIPPILILEGDADGVVPDDNFDTLKRLVPYAKFERVRDAGHFPMVEQKEQVLSALTAFISAARKSP